MASAGSKTPTSKFCHNATSLPTCPPPPAVKHTKKRLSHTNVTQSVDTHHTTTSLTHTSLNVSDTRHTTTTPLSLTHKCHSSLVGLSSLGAGLLLAAPRDLLRDCLRAGEGELLLPRLRSVSWGVTGGERERERPLHSHVLTTCNKTAAGNTDSRQQNVLSSVS